MASPVVSETIFDRFDFVPLLICIGNVDLQEIRFAVSKMNLQRVNSFALNPGQHHGGLKFRNSLLALNHAAKHTLKCEMMPAKLNLAPCVPGSVLPKMPFDRRCLPVYFRERTARWSQKIFSKSGVLEARRVRYAMRTNELAPLISFLCPSTLTHFYTLRVSQIIL